MRRRQVVDPSEADGLVWADPAVPERLPESCWPSRDRRAVGRPALCRHRALRALPRHATGSWTCARGVYARPVAEHALMLGLAGLRGLSTYARATTWSAPEGHNLVDGRVTVFGAGGITEELLGLLQGWGIEVTVVRRRADPFPGAASGPWPSIERSGGGGRCRPGHPGPGPHPGDRRGHRGGRADGDGAPRLAGQRGPGRACRQRCPVGRPSTTASSVGPAST